MKRLAILFLVLISMTATLAESNDFVTFPVELIPLFVFQLATVT